MHIALGKALSQTTISILETRKFELGALVRKSQVEEVKRHVEDLLSNIKIDYCRSGNL